MVKIHEIVEDYEPVVLYSEKALIRKSEVKEVKDEVLETAPLTDNTIEVLRYLAYEMVNPEHCEYLTILMAILRTLFPGHSITVKTDDNFDEYFVIE